MLAPFIFLFTATSLLLMAPATASAQNLITNPGFETGDFTGWTLGGDTRNLIVVAGTTNSPANSGSFYANFGEINSLGTITQNVATISGQQYSLSFYLANYGSGSTATPNQFRLTVGGTVLFDQTNLPYQPFYQQRTFTFFASGNSTAVQFGGYDPPYALFLDDVRLTGPSGSAPEPTSIAYLALSVLPMIGIIVRRRQKNGE